MSREWKAGDVAVTDRDGRVSMIVVGCRIHELAKGPHWHHANGGWDFPELVVSGPARPLVVIDPEDADQVERLRDIVTPHIAFAANLRSTWQAALREFADPKPRIEEPRGLGAVVRDSSGLKWIRVTNTPGTFPWLRDGHGVEGWSNIDAVEVLSEGVTS